MRLPYTEFRFSKTRKGGEQALALGFGVVDTGQERLGDLVQCLERRDDGSQNLPAPRLASSLLGGMKRSRPMRSLPKGEMRGEEEEGLEPGRNQQEDSFRQPHRPAFRKDVDLPSRVVRPQQPFSKT